MDDDHGSFKRIGNDNFFRTRHDKITSFLDGFIFAEEIALVAEVIDA